MGGRASGRGRCSGEWEGGGWGGEGASGGGQATAVGRRWLGGWQPGLPVPAAPHSPVMLGGPGDTPFRIMDTPHPAPPTTPPPPLPAGRSPRAHPTSRGRPPAHIRGRRGAPLARAATRPTRGKHDEIEKKKKCRGGEASPAQSCLPTSTYIHTYIMSSRPKRRPTRLPLSYSPAHPPRPVPPPPGPPGAQRWTCGSCDVTHAASGGGHPSPPPLSHRPWRGARGRCTRAAGGGRRGGAAGPRHMAGEDVVVHVVGLGKQ